MPLHYEALWVAMGCYQQESRSVLCCQGTVGRSPKATAHTYSAVELRAVDLRLVRVYIIRHDIIEVGIRLPGKAQAAFRPAEAERGEAIIPTFDVVASY